MDKYSVKLMPRASRDLDGIYTYICEEFQANETAEELIDLLMTSILKLDEMPYRGAIRNIGKYANQGYRQLFVKKYTIVYRVDEITKTVIIVTVRYTASVF